MFDAGRILVFGWAFYRVARAREWGAAAVVTLAAYLFALSVASGLRVRADGPMSPLLAVVLGLVGPTAMPRGAPAAPSRRVGRSVLRSRGVAPSAALLLVVRRMLARVRELPQFSPQTHRIARASLALVLLAVFEGLAAAVRALPTFLDWTVG